MLFSHSLEQFLRQMEYPATRDDLLREAVRDGLSPDDRALLQAVPEQNYGAAWQVRLHLAPGTFSNTRTPSLVSV